MVIFGCHVSFQECDLYIMRLHSYLPANHMNMIKMLCNLRCLFGKGLPFQRDLWYINVHRSEFVDGAAPLQSVVANSFRGYDDKQTD